ncbi:GntR family transcriptional regulator [Actinoplanes philippinensis]|uniref:GntR family transcriptional regulator n=1 Tax=Actinoplanes philippinensis TaxID=35752 RepID=A0A1I2ELY8_9ACTN|nr:GntR family transcriptional regulator [Actinoplanes philippinensis]SFE93250.1 GntR family transcriptional regulator [Actinoplanes philippinensis]
MIFRIDRRTGVSVHVQLVQQVRQAIRMGRLTSGDQLPTAREVSESTGINPNTVLKAYRELETAGLVEARQGAGTFVRRGLAPPADDEALRRELADWVARAREAGLDLADMQALVADVTAGTAPTREEARRAD